MNELNRWPDNILTYNLTSLEDIQKLEKAPALSRKILDFFKNTDIETLTEEERMNELKNYLHIDDEAVIYNMLGRTLWNKYFGNLKIERLKYSNKDKIIHVIQRTPEDEEEIKEERKRRKAQKKQKKEKWCKKGQQLRITFPKC